MESTSRGSGASRISTAASALYSDNQSLIAEIRKSISTFRAIAVDLERNEKDDKVKRLEEAMLELLETYDDCTRFSDAIKSLGDSYQPSDQPTNFKKSLEHEVAKTKAASRSDPQSNPLYRSFKEAVWAVILENIPDSNILMSILIWWATAQECSPCRTTNAWRRAGRYRND